MYEARGAWKVPLKRFNAMGRTFARTVAAGESSGGAGVPQINFQEQNSGSCITPTWGACPLTTESQQCENACMRIKNLLKQLVQLALYGLASWTFACPLATQAAVVNVSIQDYFFNPAAVTINVNDQILWTWADADLHSSTSGVYPTPDGLWESGLFAQQGVTFSHSFTSAGTFPYYCSYHGFTGSVTVQAANVPPSVAITAPTNGAVFAAPWTGAIKATASDSDGTVSKVDFFAGTTRLGTVTSPPPSPS